MHNNATLKNILSVLAAKERSFFPSHLSLQLKEFYCANTLQNFALSSAAIFDILYLYTIGFSIAQIILFYLCAYVIHFFCMPLGGKLAKIHGFAHGMVYGTFFLILYFLFLVFIPEQSLFTVLAVFALGLYKALYWPAYHADFAFFGQSGERGREIGNLVALNSFFSILGPIAGGTILTLFGFPLFFAFVCSVIVLSNIPLLATREVFTPSFFSYRESYAQLIDRRNRKYLIGYMGLGEEFVALILWPIFIYLAFGSFLGTGTMIAFSLLITVCVVLYIGKLSDISDRKKVLRIGALFTGLSWLLRTVVKIPIGVFVVDFFSRITRNVFMLPLASGLYEHASKTSIMRTVVFFEMSLTVGKILMALLLLAIFSFVPPPYQWGTVFSLAALFSLLYLTLTFSPSEHFATTRLRPVFSMLPLLSFPRRRESIKEES